MKEIWITECVVPSGTNKRFYTGHYAYAAEICLKGGYESNAASWLHKDICKYKESFSAVKGSLSVECKNGIKGISYIDIEDVVLELQNTYGDGI